MADAPHWGEPLRAAIYRARQSPAAALAPPAPEARCSNNSVLLRSRGPPRAAHQAAARGGRQDWTNPRATVLPRSAKSISVLGARSAQHAALAAMLYATRARIAPHVRGADLPVSNVLSATIPFPVNLESLRARLAPPEHSRPYANYPGMHVFWRVPLRGEPKATKTKKRGFRAITFACFPPSRGTTKVNINGNLPVCILRQYFRLFYYLHLVPAGHGAARSGSRRDLFVPPEEAWKAMYRLAHSCLVRDSGTTTTGERRPTPRRLGTPT